MNWSDLMPPVFVKLVRRVKHGPRLFSSYDEALAHCGAGYEADALINVVLEKTRRYRDRLRASSPLVVESEAQRLLAGLGLCLDGPVLNVLDFGGACGAHYFLARALLEGRCRLHWHVVETPAMVAQAKVLEEDGLRFFSSLTQAQVALDRLDLVYTSSTLPYVPRPYETLAELVDCQAKHIFITRVALSTQRQDVVTVQKTSLCANGPGPLPDGVKDGDICYPVTYARMSEVERILGTHYTIQAKFHEGVVCVGGGDNRLVMCGYLGRLRQTGKS